MDRSRRLKVYFSSSTYIISQDNDCLTLPAQFFLGVGFGVVCVVTTMALVLVLRDSETLAKFPSYGHEQAEDAITFEEFINGEFGYKTFNGSWWSETELQWKNAVMLVFKPHDAKGLAQGRRSCVMGPGDERDQYPCLS